MRSLLLLGVYLAYLSLGAGAPFICALGYIWVDLFTPQNVAYSLMDLFPVSLVMAVCTIVFYVTMDRRSPPRITVPMVLLFGWICWVTLTTSWAEFQDPAWFKWNWAIKSAIFAMILPFLFRSRVQIEAAILTVLLAISGNLLTFGIKTILSGGGGYGRQWTLASSAAGNNGLNESSTIALVAAAVIPLVLFIKRQSLIIPKSRYLNLAYAGIITFAVLTCLGSFARAGLVALFVLVSLIWLRSRHKLIMLVFLAMVGAGLFAVMPDSWHERMSTMSNPQGDTSAATRLAVWQWTLDYVQQHPFGGGFDAYRANSFTLHMPDGTEQVERGRAFHSMYFEVLGEQGYVGFAIFSGLIGTFFLGMMRVSRKAKGIPELAWLRDLAQTLMTFGAVYLAGGAFVGISFQPLLYYMLALGIAVSEYYRRCVAMPAAVLPCGPTTPVPLEPSSSAAPAAAGYPVRRGSPSGVWAGRSGRPVSLQ